MIGGFQEKKKTMNIQQTEIAKWENGIKEFIRECFERFGHMNKNDYEVALLHLLLENQNQESDFSLSRKLQVPESKIKRLRYEVSLVYPEEETSLENKLLSEIINGNFKLTLDRIQFAINDKMLRTFLNDKLQQGHRFADSSFNSNIVSLTASDLIFLLKQCEEEERKSIINAIKNTIKDNQQNLPKTTWDNMANFGVNVIKAIGGNIAGNLVSTVIEEITAIKNNNKKSVQ